MIKTKKNNAWTSDVSTHLPRKLSSYLNYTRSIPLRDGRESPKNSRQGDSIELKSNVGKNGLILLTPRSTAAIGPRRN